MIFHGNTPVNEVILHTAATPGSWHEGKTIDMMIKEIDSWHRQRWPNGRGIGYHRVIAPDGSTGIGRSLYETGAHVQGYNTGTIGICLIPVRTHNGIKTFDDYFTQAQKASLKSYLKELGKLTEIKKVTGHNQYSPKECPGFYVRTEDWYDG